ncbi:hypothetical protein QL285_026882 [Trifolium repens]|nr:hypothetical protein QL285_026882 [Trifolium repens]
MLIGDFKLEEACEGETLIPDFIKREVEFQFLVVLPETLDGNTTRIRALSGSNTTALCSISKDLSSSFRFVLKLQTQIRLQASDSFKYSASASDSSFTFAQPSKSRVQGKQWQLDVHFIIAGSVDGRYMVKSRSYC